MAVAAMGAAMVSLIEDAHESRTPAATAWILCAGTAVVLGATMLVAASLQAWERDRGLYRPLSRTCAAVAVACLGVAAVRPAPLLLGLAEPSEAAWPGSPGRPKMPDEPGRPPRACSLASPARSG